MPQANRFHPPKHRSFIVMSPYLGPLLAAFMTATKPWSSPFWLFTALCVLSLILTALFVEETYYDRGIPASEQPPKGSRIARLTGISQWRSRHLRNSAGQAIWRVISVILKPTVFLANLYYILVSITRTKRRKNRNMLLTPRPWPITQTLSLIHI